MKLTRRDAIIALGALGGGAAVVGSGRRDRRKTIEEGEAIDNLYAAAEAIYPSEVEVERSFISTFVRGRYATREEDQEAQIEAVSSLVQRTRHLTGRSFTDLSIEEREDVIRAIGIHRSPPVPDGTTEERIRYYVLNDLLYVLFTTPTGGELVGCENPPGYPGGRNPYQRPPLP